MIGAIKTTAKRLYQVHAQEIDAYKQLPLNPCGYELIPDFSNE